VNQVVCIPLNNFYSSYLFNVVDEVFHSVTYTGVVGLGKGLFVCYESICAAAQYFISCAWRHTVAVNIPFHFMTSL
jgi:hypothetical protein